MKIERFLGIMICLTLMLTLLPVSASADEAVPPTPFYDGYAINYGDDTNDTLSSEYLTTQTSNITMEAWVKADTLSAEGKAVRIMYNGDSGRTGYGIYLGSNKPCILMGGKSFIDFSPAVSLTTSRWYHLAAVLDGTTWTLYVNGVAYTDLIYSDTRYVGAAPYAPTEGNTFTVGNRTDISENFTGSIDEVRFWTVARTEQQIKDNMYIKLNGNEDGLLAYYNFDQTGINPNGDNTGVTTVTDVAGGDHPLAISGFALNGDNSNFVSSVNLGTFALGRSAYYAREGDGDFAIPIVRTGGSEGSVTINYQTANGTATAGTNYTSTVGSVTFEEGDMEKSVTVPILNSSIGTQRAFTFTITGQNGVSITAPSATVTITPNESILLGTGGINSPVNSGGATAYHYVYFGNNGTPIKWRVLDAANGNAVGGTGSLSDGTNPVSNSGAMLLLMENLYDNLKSSYAPNLPRGAAEIRDYHHSDLYTATTAMTTSYFTSSEQASMLQTSMNDAVYYVRETEGNVTNSHNTSNILAGDKLFPLSVQEADLDAYFPNGKADRIAECDSTAGVWRLRSRTGGGKYAVKVNESGIFENSQGNVSGGDCAVKYYMRPAFNLNKSNVLFTSAAEGGKSAAGMNSTLTEVAKNSPTGWKLTLLDTARTFDVLTTAVTATTAGGRVDIAYSGAKVQTEEAPEYLSAMLVDSLDNVLYYGRLKSIAGDTDASGTQSITIPSGLAAGSYTLKVFNEQYNGDYNTDYSSAFQDVALTITPPLTMTPSVTGCTQPYDGEEHGITVTMKGANIKYGTESGTYTLDASPTYKNVGTYTVYYQVTKTNYTTVTGSETVSITPKSIAAVWSGEDGSTTDFSWVYDGNPHAPTAAATTDVVGEAVTLKVTGAATEYSADAYTATAGIYPSDSNYILTNTTKVFTITQASTTISSADDTITYDGSTYDVSQLFTIPDTAGSASYSVVTGGTGAGALSGSALTITKAGTIIIKVTTANGNYAAAEQTATLTVNARPITVTIADKSSVYGAALAVLTAKVTSGSIVVGDANVYSLSTTATPTSAVGSDYTITGTQNNTNYAVTFTGSNGTIARYSVTNATLTEVSVTGYTGTYDGAAHSISVKPVTVNAQKATVTYKAGDATDYVEDNPGFTNAGEYTVYYKITAPNHGEKTGSATVKINRKALTTDMIGNITDPIYNGNTHTPTPAVSWTPVGGSELTLTAGEDQDFTFSYANNTNAAPYKAAAAPTVTITAVDGGNYSGNARKTFTIAPQPVTLTWNYTAPFTYNTTAQTVTASVSNGIGEDNFTLTYSDNSKTNAGDYTATVTGLGNSNYTLTGESGTTQSWVIQKAPVSFTVADNGYTYDATAHTATVTQTANETPSVAGVFTVTYQKDSETASASKTDAGVYDIIVTLNDANFKFAGQDDTARNLTLTEKLTIGKKSITAQWKNQSHVYDGNTKTPTMDFTGAGIEPGDSGNVGAVLSGEQSKSDAGSYTVRATLSGTRSHNYELTNPTGSFIIQRAPVTFTVSDNIVQHNDESHAATVTASANGSSFIDFAITYHNAKGENAVAPTDAGSYDIYAEISNKNYRHAGAADGGARKIGVLTIYRVSPPATYTVSFEGGTGATGATDALAAAQTGTSRILPDCGFTVTGKTFTGWKYNGSVYQPDERLNQPAANITLTAQWTENVYAIAGVVDRDGNPLTDVVVTLMLGSEQIDRTTTDASGTYSFSNVLLGLYNLVASKNGVTQTILLEIAAADETGKNITMPSGRTNSVVEVTAGSPAIVVGNLEKTFETPDDNNPCYTDADAGIVEDGGSVEIKLTAGAKTVTEQPIEEAASGTVGLYLDMTLTKTVTPAVGDPVITPLDETAALLEMVIKLPGELQRKDSYTVYRVHEGQVQALNATPNKDGEHITVNADKTAITVYAKFFSSYAVAYTTYSSSNNTGYTPVVPAVEHGTIAVTPKAPYYVTTGTITATPDPGYQLASLVVTDRNGNAVTLTEKPDGTFTFTQPRGSVTVKASFRLIVGMPFTDVTERDWFRDDVRYVYENGLMQGTGDTTFGPQLTTTRGMMVTILYRLEGEPAISGDCPLDDVEAGKYYENPIVWAASNHIVEGYGNGKFGPEDPITREQMAAMLYRYATYKGYDLSATADLGRFIDEGKISDYARTAMQWANANEMVNGRDGSILDPRGYASRLQVAAIVHRFCEKFVMPQSAA